MTYGAFLFCAVGIGLWAGIGGTNDHSCSPNLAYHFGAGVAYVTSLLVPAIL